MHLSSYKQPSVFPSVERRLTLRLLAYWEKVRSGRVMPTEKDITKEDIPDLWESCFLVHVEQFDQPGYHYTFLGKDILNAWIGNLKEGDAKELVSPSAERLAAIYNQLIREPKPLIQEGEFKNLEGNIVRFRQCFLPLGEESRVTAILGGMRFKIFKAS